VYWINAGGTLQVYCNMDDYGGGWTLVLRAGMGYDLTAGNQTVAVGSSPTEATKPANGSAQKLSDDVINQIRTNAGGAIGYWVLTPGDGNGKYGAEIFHRSDCAFKMQQNASQVKATTCHQWTVDYSPDKPNWQSGTHWHDSDTPAYGWAFGYLNSVSQCQGDGKGLGVHAGSHAPFHRGWCGTQAWGLVYVR
jgi:hypothetical protein